MTSPRPLPSGPLIAFYGDDFTGSSASMEATAFAGLETVLFLSLPTPERLRAFASARVIGIAGTARAQNPQWMDENLPPVFDLLAATGAPVVHYKVCSTFDSAPHVGSIGRAIEIAARRFGGWTPMIVADPGMVGIRLAEICSRPFMAPSTGSTVIPSWRAIRSRRWTKRILDAT